MSSHADTIRDYLAPHTPGEHHSNCNSHSGLKCDCYALRSNAAFVALDALLAENQQIREALREIDTSMPLPDEWDAAEWWKHVASKRREIARAAVVEA